MPMLFLFSRKTNHRIKPKARYGLIAVAGLSLFLSGCVTKAQYRKDVDAAYAKGKAEAPKGPTYQDLEEIDKAYAAKIKKIVAEERAKCKPRDEQGRFIKVNGQTVDLDGK